MKCVVITIVLAAAMIVSREALAVDVATPVEEDSVSAASASPPSAWIVGTHAGLSRFSSDRPGWYENVVRFGQRNFGGSSAFVELGRVSRHGEPDLFAAADLYRVVRPGSYVNARLAVAPRADIMPRFDGYAEGFHGVGRGWEISNGYRFARFTGKTIHSASAGIGRYVGNWYLRTRGSITPASGTMGHGLLVMARRYSGGPDEFVGVVLATGRDVVAYPDGPVELRNVISASVVVQRFVRAGAGVRIGIDYVDDGDLTRWGLAAGLIARW